MSIRKGLLALLAQGPRHGYGLKTSFEERTGHAWPLNIGQVYTTLQRLERDGAVVADEETDGHQVYRLSELGREELTEWFQAPVLSDPPPRDELVIKVLLAVATPEVDVSSVLQAQRTAAVARLQQLTRLKIDADPESDRAWLLTAERLIFDTEAEVRWLEFCEGRLAGAGVDGSMSRAEAVAALEASQQETRR